jgi:serine/threonine-protein kinase HipA
VTIADVEVYIDLDGSPRPVGLLRRHASRREETVTFEYDETWLADDERFSIEPALALTRGVFPPPPDQSVFGSIGDSTPNTWGRRLMQRAERRQAERDGRRVCTLGELESRRAS